MAKKQIRKVVIPVAGYGTRFLPYTKSIPKEMLPIVDQPVIHHIAVEAAEAGITEIILITGYNKRTIEDYFDYNLELEYLLEKKGKLTERELSREISNVAKFVYVRQKEQLGTGHALLQAKELIGPDEPFMVMWGDEMFMGKPTKVQQLVDVYDKYQQPVLITKQCTNDEDYNRYGYIKPDAELEKGIWKVGELIEKPGRDNAPSPYASLGCFILTGEIFPILENQTPGIGGEIVLADSINTFAKTYTLLAKEIEGLTYFDCGNKLEYMKATVEFALKRKDIGADFESYLKNLVDSL